MRCSSSLCLVEAPTTDAIFIVWQLQEKCIAAANKQLYFAFLTVWKPSVMCLERSCGRPWGAWVWTNRLCVIQGMDHNARRALFSAHCSSTWCSKNCRASSALVCHGCFSMLMTWCSSQTPRRSVSPSLSSRQRRLVWEVKGSVVTLRKPSSWSLVLTWMSYRKQASIPVLSAARVSATTPLSACSASYGSARGTVASLVDWWMPGTTPAPGVKAIIGPLTAEQWPKRMLKASSLMWRTLSAI